MPRDTQPAQKGRTGNRVSGDLHLELSHTDPKTARREREAKARKCTREKAFTKENEPMKKSKWKV